MANTRSLPRTGLRRNHRATFPARAHGVRYAAVLAASASSPTYNGSPRFVRGVIEVEGYVQGDGTLTLDGAVFQVRRG